MICDKCTNSVCKAYRGTCRRYRFLKLITFGMYKRTDKKLTAFEQIKIGLQQAIDYEKNKMDGGK